MSELLPKASIKAFGSVAVPIKDQNNELSQLGVKMHQVKINGKIEVVFDQDDITEKVILPQIREKKIFKGTAKNMNTEINNATEEVKGFIRELSGEVSKLRAQQAEICDTAKKTSGHVRDAVEKLANGVKKIESAANFDKLERMTNLLERAADAMERLDNLQTSGKLDKILNAIK